MGFKEVMKAVIEFRDQYKDPFTDDLDSQFKAYEHYDVRPFDQLHYDLMYAHADNIYSNDFLRIYTRKYKDCLLKFILVDDFNIFKKENFDFSTNNLKELVKDLPFEYGNINDFDMKKEINYIIFNNKEEEVKKYSFLYTKSEKNKIIKYFAYDNTQNVIINYRMTRPYLNEYYRTGLFFDLSAIDRKRY